MFFRGHRKNRANDRGGVMVESVMLIPLFVTIFFGVTEVGGLLVQYMALEHAVGEAARAAAKITLIETGNFEDMSTSSDPQCLGGNASVKCPRQLQAQKQIRTLLGRSLLGISGMTTDTSYADNSAATPSNRNTVMIKLSGTYDGITPLFRNMRISTTKRISYVYTRG